MSGRALILVDLQNDYFAGGRFTLAGIEAAAANAARLLAAARAAGELVVHVRHESPDPAAPFFVAGSEGAAIHPSVLPRAGEPVVVKARVNAFLGTDLKEILDKRGIAEIVVAGAMSHMCVDAATRAALDFGYGVSVVHDAATTRDLAFGGVLVPAAQVHAAMMAALAAARAAVISTEEALAR